MANKNPFENSPRLVLPLGTRADEFEEFLVMGNNMFHVTDWIDNPGEWSCDDIYHYRIDGNNIYVQCVFNQVNTREEGEKETTQTIYIAENKIFTKGITDIKDADKYEDGELTYEEKITYNLLKYQNSPHLIEQDKEDRTSEAVAKIKAFLFYQTLGKEKAKELIQNEIDKLGNCREIHIKELNEIMETGNIKRPKHYEGLYCMEGLREMAKDDKSPEGKKHLEEVENVIRQMKEDQ